MSTEIFDSLSDSERSGLIVLPAAIFILIAGADGNVDDKEVATFNRLLSSVDDSDQDLTSICVRRLRASSSGLVATLATMMEQGSSESSARLAAQIAWQKFPNQVVTDYFEDLLELAKQIAAASGGLFGGSISKEEKQALAAIRKLLFIDARVAAQTPQHGPQATESQPTYDYDSVKERFAVRVYADEHPKLHKFLDMGFMKIPVATGLTGVLGIEDIGPEATVFQTISEQELAHWRVTEAEILEQALKNFREPGVLCGDLSQGNPAARPFILATHRTGSIAPILLCLDKFPQLQGINGAIILPATQHSLYSLPIFDKDYFRQIPLLARFGKQLEPGEIELTQQLYVYRDNKLQKFSFEVKDGQFLVLPDEATETLQAIHQELAQAIQ